VAPYGHHDASPNEVQNAFSLSHFRARKDYHQKNYTRQRSIYSWQDPAPIISCFNYHAYSYFTVSDLD